MNLRAAADYPGGEWVEQSGEGTTITVALATATAVTAISPALVINGSSPLLEITGAR